MDSAQSRLAVSEPAGEHTGRWSAGGGTIQVPVPAGGRITLLVQLTGPQPLARTVIVTTPAPLDRASGASSGRWLVYTSGPLRPGSPQLLCGTDKVSFLAPSQVAVAESARACPARLRLTGQDGEQLAVPLTVPARSTATLPAVSVDRLYCFARPAGRAIYITIDDGWTPSAEVLDLMHRTYLPITAFLIANAARQNLSYWKAFVAAGGMIGDHTVSIPTSPGSPGARPRPSGGRTGRCSAAGWVRPRPSGARRTGPSTPRWRWRRRGAG